MADAAARGWGNPGPPGSANARRYERDNIVTVHAGSVRLRVHHLIAPLVKGFCDELVARGYPLAGRPDDWGFIVRWIRGLTGTLSNHSWGLAIDLNAITNPFSTVGVLRTDMPPWVIDLARKWGLSWGALWTGRRKDPMHFEFLGTPDDARRLVSQLHVLDHHGIKEELVYQPITVEHPAHGFVVIQVDGSTLFYPDNRSPLNKRTKKRRAPKWLGGMTSPKLKGARKHAPGVLPSGGYFVDDKAEVGRKGDGHALVITYPDGGYYQFPSDARLAR